ncbi:hypothetical protein B0H67DRAFT_594940 [Lasiosphaeris hirsuta]|uniref:Uncharacterized protein n=1 Tax=Lasiosphaeris hirsuta TaxID=260670 RepID=A0AA39ZS98_9PEZI|nr:hypothetical protein B0H67DRAFT_594940 [Lasiosphaeris hirsuta]
MPTLEISCHYGGSFFVCDHNTTEFVMCCTINPCAGGQGLCLPDSLYNVSFPQQRFDDIPRLEYARERTFWYIYNFTSPPFLGCCKKDACITSYEKTALLPAKLGNDIAARNAFPNDSGTSPAPAESPATPTPQVPAGALSSPVTAVITLGSTAFVAIIAASMYAWGRHRGRKAQSRSETATERIPGPTATVPAWNELPECAAHSQRGYAAYMPQSPTVVQMAGNYELHNRDELFFH